jgi:hypothetical protein
MRCGPGVLGFLSALRCCLLLQIGAFHLQQMLASSGVNSDEAVEKAQTILGAFSEAPPFPDVGEALERLHGAGIKVDHEASSGSELQCVLSTARLGLQMFHAHCEHWVRSCPDI